jgi:NAD(P)H dehydrogenase (quinone)
MSPVVVLVTFYSRGGSTETLASSAAVGAVQRRALIRLRRVPDSSAEETLHAFPECRDTLVRMYKEYVAPTEGDITGADAIVVAPPGGFEPTAPVWRGYFEMLTKLASEGKLGGKVAAVVDAGHEATVQSFSGSLSRLGLSLPSGGFDVNADAAERARELGRRVVDLVRARGGPAVP